MMPLSNFACDFPKFQPKINSILNAKPTEIITEPEPCSGYYNRRESTTTTKTTKISSGQFNSNLNPIKDLVTNPLRNTYINGSCGPANHTHTGKNY